MNAQRNRHWPVFLWLGVCAVLVSPSNGQDKPPIKPPVITPVTTTVIDGRIVTRIVIQLQNAPNNMMEPAARPLDLDIHVKLRLYAVALTERLEAKPVRIIFDLIEKMFGPTNPWFQEKMLLAVDDPVYREGYAMLFNL